MTGAGSLSLAHNSANGLLTGTTLGAVSDTYGYNAFAEPLSYQARVNGTLLFDVQYTRDDLGRIM